MVKRDPTARVVISLRLKEPLRAQLESEARENDRSLNMEIVARLEASLQNNTLGSIVFGDRIIFGLMDACARLIRLVEKLSGKSLANDPVTYTTAVETMYRFLKYLPGVAASGIVPGGTTDPFDRVALAFATKLVEDEASLILEDAQSQKPGA